MMNFSYPQRHSSFFGKILEGMFASPNRSSQKSTKLGIFQFEGKGTNAQIFNLGNFRLTRSSDIPQTNVQISKFWRLVSKDLTRDLQANMPKEKSTMNHMRIWL